MSEVRSGAHALRTGCRGCAYLAEGGTSGLVYSMCRHREVQAAMIERRLYRLKRSLPGCKHRSETMDTDQHGKTPGVWDEWLKNHGIPRHDPPSATTSVGESRTLQGSLF